jgi:cation-transporting ATPase E
MSTTGRGLSSIEVEELTARGLANVVDGQTSRSIWSIVRANVLTLFNGVVLGGFIVLLALGRWQDALFGFTAICNAAIGVVQEFRAKRSLDRLAVLHAPLARVDREGGVASIAVAEVVQGDLLLLRAGDQVTADGTVLDSTRLEVDESLLTGESDPVSKQMGTEVLSGSIVVAGEARVRVTRVGSAAFANTLTAQARRFSLVRSELRGSVDRLLRWIAWAIVPITAVVVNSQIQAQGGWETAIASGSWREAAVGSIAAVVMMIPLGLVLMTSIAFTVGSMKLSRRQVLVNELPAVEGLARVDVICLDKTGTLTDGTVSFDAVHPTGTHSKSAMDAVLGWMGRDPAGNATAQCLAASFPAISGLEPAQRVEFSSARKWSAVTFTAGSNQPDVGGTWVFGAPEMVLPSTDDHVLGAAVDLAANGLRTLVLAHAPAGLTAASAAAAALPAGLRPVALLTFRETLRPDAADTLRYFEQQGVAVRIVSGDNPHTVAAVARNAGIEATGYDARQLPEDPGELAALLDREHVLGRVTPQQKKAIVEALQHAGHTVAMTGDGVNDALAIKTADLGIAMASGSSATKAVARLVLLDGRFASLPAVVDEGRQVTANIERVSMLFLTKTTYAISLGLAFGALLWGFPFLPRHVAITDALTIGIPAFFLALLPNARRYRPGFLRRSLTFAIPAGLTVATALIGVGAMARANNVPHSEAQTASMITLALLGLWVLTILARPLTLRTVALIAAMYVGLVLVLLLPPAAQFFALSPVRPVVLVVVAIAGTLGIVVLEVLRSTLRRRESTREMR